MGKIWAGKWDLEPPLQDPPNTLGETDGEKGRMFCLLCKKHNTSNIKNNSKIYNLTSAQRFKTDALKEHVRSAQHTAVIEAEMIRRVSVFHKDIESQEKSKDEVLPNAFMAVYWLAKEEMTNNRFLNYSKCLD